MMMLGGSPIRVAVPPMLEARASAIKNGAAGMARRSQIRKVTGATSSTVVTLSNSADASAVMVVRVTRMRNGRPPARLADQMAR
jgi:hypothetical protein